MKFFCLAMLTIMAAARSPKPRPFTNDQVINFAKTIDVHRLDKAIPSQTLDHWLRNGPPHANIRWDVSETCDNKPIGNEDYPLCAKVWFSREGQAGSFLVEVGTFHKGLNGEAKLYSDILSWENGPGWIITDGPRQLSGLGALLNQPAYGQTVQRLYAIILKWHPIGIPEGATMASIRPLLSNRLAAQLDSAKACETEYVRQAHSSALGTAKPEWLESGLFSGDGARSAPTSAWPVREGVQKDGSYMVSVNLFSQSIDVGEGLRGGAYSQGGNWRVQVKVISADGQLLIDNVRLFSRTDSDGPSRLLSDMFVGCEGGHWRPAGQN